MAWWNRLFKKKEPIQQEEDWEQLVYTRNGVNFDEEDQRKRYIVNCLEQIAEASKEIDLLTGEYTLVTSYLTDTDEIEALPAEQREEVNRVAGKLAGLEQERSRYREKKNRMRDADFYAIRKRENEIEEGIQKIRDGEKYGNLIRQDLHRLDGERHAYEYRRNELENLMNNQRGMAVIFLTALIVCVIMLVILQYAFEMDVYVGLFLAVGAGAVAISYVCIRYMDAGRELQRVEKTINKIIQLQNKVKIRYVNNCQLMEYLYLKYNTDSAAKLEKQWKMYQDEKEERTFAEGVENGLIRFVGDDCKKALYDAIEARQVRPGLCRTAGLKLVYSPLNGSGLVPVTHVLNDMGITDITIVPEQEYPNGYFTTCSYPNPEIFEALKLGLELATKTGADLMLATDPDADRVGIAMKCPDGSYELVSGNEMGVLLLDYICAGRIEKGTMPKNPVAVKSIVSTPLADAVACDHSERHAVRHDLRVPDADKLLQALRSEPCSDERLAADSRHEHL